MLSGGTSKIKKAGTCVPNLFILKNGWQPGEHSNTPDQLFEAATLSI